MFSAYHLHLVYIEHVIVCAGSDVSLCGLRCTVTGKVYVITVGQRRRGDVRRAVRGRQHGLTPHSVRSIMGACPDKWGYSYVIVVYDMVRSVGSPRRSRRTTLEAFPGKKCFLKYKTL